MNRLLLILPLLTLGLTACKDEEEPEPTPERLILGKWQLEKIENIAVIPTGELVDKETETYGKDGVHYKFDSEGILSISSYGSNRGSGEYRVEELEGNLVVITGQDWYADTVQISILDSEKMVWEKSREQGEHYHENFPSIQVWYAKDTHTQITTFSRVKE